MDQKNGSNFSSADMDADFHEPSLLMIGLAISSNLIGNQVIVIEIRSIHTFEIRYGKGIRSEKESQLNLGSLGFIQLRDLYEQIFLQPLCYQPPMAELAGKLPAQEHLSLQVISYMNGI
jgi:hypothetical protein